MGARRKLQRGRGQQNKDPNSMMETLMGTGSSTPSQRWGNTLCHTQWKQPASAHRLGSSGEELIFHCYLTPANSCNLSILPTPCPHYPAFHLVRRWEREGWAGFCSPRHRLPQRTGSPDPTTQAHLRPSLSSYLTCSGEQGFWEDNWEKEAHTVTIPWIQGCFLSCETCVNTP